MKQYKVEPSKKISLAKLDPNETGDFDGGKEKGLKMKYPKPKDNLDGIVIE
jgi:hypothetical protein